MRKILVIGCPGAGKSTFARKLAYKTGLPLHYLDQLFWHDDQTTVSVEEFDGTLAKILDEDQWIIDGNYLRTMPQRLQACDTVFYLDYPMSLCLESVIQRRGKRRPDLPWVEPENLHDPEFQAFLQYIRDFPHQQKPLIEQLLLTHSDKTCQRFTNRKMAETFLNEME